MSNIYTIQDREYRNLQKIISANSKRLRNEHGLSQTELAKKSGIDVYYIRSVEYGKTKTTKIGYVEGLAKAYEMSPDEIYCELTKSVKEDSLPYSFDEAAMISFSDIYPYNLAKEIVGNTGGVNICCLVDPYGFYRALDTLSDREQKVISLRWKDGLTLEDVGKAMGVTRERIRQVEAKAIRKLSHPSRRKIWASPSKETYSEMRIKWKSVQSENAYLKSLISKFLDSQNLCIDGLTEEALSVDSIDISELELSVRSYNCLRRAGLNNIGSLRDKTLDDMCHIRNLGRKSIDEISCLCREKFGVELMF